MRMKKGSFGKDEGFIVQSLFFYFLLLRTAFFVFLAESRGTMAL